jgi:hypothetical protein
LAEFHEEAAATTGADFGSECFAGRFGSIDIEAVGPPDDMPAVQVRQHTI